MGGPPGHLTGTALEVVMTLGMARELRLVGPAPRRLRPRGRRRRRVGVGADGGAGRAPGLRIDARVVSGHPAPILVEASKGADLLVVGSRGHGEFVGMLLGSVSEYCATNALCPVLIHRGRATP